MKINDPELGEIELTDEASDQDQIDQADQAVQDKIDVIEHS
jgi:hypothetical protein